jgi:hypothetical protein
VPGERREKGGKNVKKNVPPKNGKKLALTDGGIRNFQKYCPTPNDGQRQCFNTHGILSNMNVWMYLRFGSATKKHVQSFHVPTPENQ